MNADGSGLTQLTTEGEETSPVWSPDGSKIAFVSRRDGNEGNGNSEIYVMNADGSNQTNLTNTPGLFGEGMQELNPDWGVSAAPATETVTQEVNAGQTPTTVTTDAEDDGATPSDPVETHLTIPAGVGGSVSITETSTTQQPPAGFSFLDQQVEITAPAATPNNPLTLELRIDSSKVPSGQTESDIEIFRNGVRVGDCTGASATASPDPCVASKETLTDGDVSVTVRTSQASDWNFGVLQDTTVPTTTTSAIAGGNAYNSGDLTNKDVTLTLTADDGQGGSGVEKITYAATGAQPISETAYDPQDPPKITTEGETTITYYATDKAGNIEDRQTITVKIDKSAPKVQTVAPTNGATQVSRATNVVATFAEAMNSATLSKTTFKLYKGTTQITNVRVTPSADGTRATLNPYGGSATVLAKNTTYLAVVSTGAKDLAGNSLDQTSRISGNQPMLWSFKTGSK